MPRGRSAFDNAKRRAGLCDYTRKRISVSRYLAARYDDDTNHQTLLHEVAHALAGRGCRARPRWKAVARDLGYVGGATHDGETATELAPWIGGCAAGHVAYRHRRVTRPTSCAKCAPRFDERFLFAWTRREITPAARLAAMQPRRWSARDEDAVAQDRNDGCRVHRRRRVHLVASAIGELATGAARREQVPGRAAQRAERLGRRGRLGRGVVDAAVGERGDDRAGAEEVLDGEAQRGRGIR